MTHTTNGIALQEVIDLQGGFVSHYEALFRIAGHSKFGSSHVAMIQAAEKEGWVDEIDLTVLLRVVEALRNFPVRIACNLSPKTVELSTSRVLSVLNDATDVTDRLILEITETAPINDPDEFCSQLLLLKATGCEIALDDYGSDEGYISPELVKKLRPDYLKLDRAVTDSKSGREAFLPRALDLAAHIGAQLVAEFIDTEEKAELIKSCGISYGQGYYFAMPRMLEEVLMHEGIPQHTDGPQMAATH